MICLQLAHAKLKETFNYSIITFPFHMFDVVFPRVVARFVGKFGTR